MTRIENSQLKKAAAKRLINRGKYSRIATFGGLKTYKIGRNYYQENGNWVDSDYNTEGHVPAGDE